MQNKICKQLQLPDNVARAKLLRYPRENHLLSQKEIVINQIALFLHCDGHILLSGMDHAIRRGMPLS